MTWFKVDDSFYDHPKVFDAPDCAVALWTRAGCWSARNLMDGFVPTGIPARLCGDPDTAIKELIHRGLWERTSGGFRFHDWPVYQPTAAEERAKRAKRAESGRLGGLAKARASKEAGESLASASPVAKQNPTPTRPDPKKNKNSSSAAPTEDDPDWLRFWETYPRRLAKAAARRAWAAAIRKTPPHTIIEAASRYAAERGNQDPKYTAHPATWLNQERWEDQTRATAQQDAIVWPWEQ